MPGTVIGKAMNVGYPGSFSRNGDFVSSSRPVKTAALKFGAAAMLNTDNTYSPATASFAMTTFAGIALREVKQASVYTSQAAGQYEIGEVGDVIERGPVIVTCVDGTPTAGGLVYICTVAGTVAAVGDITANASNASSGTTVQITNARFTTGVKDANNCVEITLIGRNQA